MAFDYFERKRPNDNTMDLWFDEVRNIPDEPLEWIKGKIFKENDNKPSNLPATMWALYNAWLQANPHKRALPRPVRGLRAVLHVCQQATPSRARPAGGSTMAAKIAMVLSILMFWPVI